MKSKLALVLVGALAATAVASAADPSMQLPRVERGKLISPVPNPPALKYPRVENGRLYINKDVSASGTLSPPSANVQFPYSKK